MDLAFGSAGGDKAFGGMGQAPSAALAGSLSPDSKLVQPPEGFELLPALGVVCSLLHGLFTSIGVR
eukprot:7755711-Alexandrium_andersonii.AAC.1